MPSTSKPLLLMILIALTGLGSAYAFHFSLAFGFSWGLAVLFCYTLRKGNTLNNVWQCMLHGAGQTREVVWILALVSLLIPAWMACGTIPYLIHICLSLLSPAHFFISAFLFSSLLSMILGTAIGTLSSIGIPLMMAGSVMGLPPHLTAGALISGAFLGDRSSPFSGAFQMVASSTKIVTSQLLKVLLPTTLGGFMLSLLYYFWQDLSGLPQQATHLTEEGAFPLQYSYNALLILPPLMLMLSFFLRIKIRHGFMLSIVSALLIGSIHLKVTFSQWIHYLWFGFESHSIPTLHGPGLLSVVDLISLIALAGSFNGLLEETNLMRPLISQILGYSKLLSLSTLRMMLFGAGLNATFCTQTLPIMIAGRNTLPLWMKRHRQSQLPRIIADSSLLFAAMIPWNMLAVLCGTILGVPVRDYLPFAIFLWITPVLTIIQSIYYDSILNKPTISGKLRRQGFQVFQKIKAP